MDDVLQQSKFNEKDPTTLNQLQQPSQLKANVRVSRKKDSDTDITDECWETILFSLSKDYLVFQLMKKLNLQISSFVLKPTCECKETVKHSVLLNLYFCLIKEEGQKSDVTGINQSDI